VGGRGWGTWFSEGKILRVGGNLKGAWFSKRPNYVGGRVRGRGAPKGKILWEKGRGAWFSQRQNSVRAVCIPSVTLNK
jgi:hypothetical protein